MCWRRLECPASGGGVLDHLRFHIYSPTIDGHPWQALWLPGPEAVCGGGVLYGVVRASVSYTHLTLPTSDLV